MSLSELILPDFDHEMANTRKVLERIPEDKLDWKVHPRSNSIGWVGMHLAEIPHWVEETLNHNIHHRAHLCVYLRLHDIPVPALYGPSADDQGMG